MPDLLNELIFLFQRLDWLSLFDILLVTVIIFVILMIVRDTQAMVLLRGVILLVILLTLLTSLVNLPAFSWLVRTTLPALLFAIPVIFAPEIRRALERLGRAGSGRLLWQKNDKSLLVMQTTIHSIVSAVTRLAARKHGALIILKRGDSLYEYIQSGVRLEAVVTPELLLQIFFPNTPLHDGAVIIVNQKVAAASCVLPLSASGILTPSPERQMGLRHRAALGISEVSDAIAVVVSEESGSVSIAHNGRMIRRLDSERLENVLMAFYEPEEISVSPVSIMGRLQQWYIDNIRQED